MKKQKIFMSIVIRILIFVSSIVFSTEPNNGLVDHKPNVTALTNAKIYTSYKNYLESGTIIIRDGLIDDVGNDIQIPIDANLIDMSGNTIYPGFIESSLINDLKKNDQDFNKHWNFKVRARKETSKLFNPDLKKIQSLRKLGFTTAHVMPDSGIFQGSTTLLQLNNEFDILNEKVVQKIDYEVDGWSSDKYPNSLLGVIALIRQTFIDANWYLNAQKIVKKYPGNDPIKLNKDLDIIGNWIMNNQPFLFNTKHELSILRSLDIGLEFKLNTWILGNGYEYRRIDEIIKHNPFMIIPINYPTNPDLNDPYQALNYSTAELKHWDIAPDNIIMLSESNIDFAITSHNSENNDFRKNLNRSIDRGLSIQKALKALTEIPALKLGLENQIGKIEKGFIANLTVVNGNYFDSKTKVLSTWIGGVEYPTIPKYKIDISGNWSMNIGDQQYELTIINNNNKFSGKILKDTLEFKLNKLKVDGRFVSWNVKWNEIDFASRFTGHFIDNNLSGMAHDMQLNWNANKIKDITIKDNDQVKEIRSSLDIFYPEGAYGFSSKKDIKKDVLITNATIWTSGRKGKLIDSDILFQNGKIKKIGKNLKVPKNVTIINGLGKHVTPGLIDCHSHSAVFSVNEGTQSITSEVRIQDVINSDDIALYRELAGGLTIANILHGSANTIGGQNAVIKLRWGQSPNNLLYKKAKPGIKFALGENVKQSNWGDDNTTRYPQTRMGVEQILRDAFTSAVEYKNEWNDYKKNKSKWKKKIPPRKNLELEALVEILDGKRQIHCHSYRQDEILMLTRVAEDFDFTVGTFQHVLEGYKVAERLKEHGANASTFSDWWAFKYEVIDAIPYNGNLMMDVGVNVSYNSDSNELARRMNTEAAKAFKYGKYGSSISEEEALHFVTINPAKQLEIDKWVGSLEVGKDADFVIWSDNPLSTQAVCEQTWIDGIKYFSIDDDIKIRNRDLDIRKTLIDKILTKHNNNDKKDWKHSEKKSAVHHHCSDEYEH